MELQGVKICARLETGADPKCFAQGPAHHKVKQVTQLPLFLNNLRTFEFLPFFFYWPSIKMFLMSGFRKKVIFVPFFITWSAFYFCFMFFTFFTTILSILISLFSLIMLIKVPKQGTHIHSLILLHWGALEY